MQAGLKKGMCYKQQVCISLWEYGIWMNITFEWQRNRSCAIHQFGNMKSYFCDLLLHRKVNSINFWLTSWTLWPRALRWLVCITLRCGVWLWREGTLCWTTSKLCSWTTRRWIVPLCWWKCLWCWHTRWGRMRLDIVLDGVSWFCVKQLATHPLWEALTLWMDRLRARNLKQNHPQ